MPVGAVTLSVEARTSLQEINKAAEAQNTANKRLSSGRKVDSSYDDAVKFAVARQLTNAASDSASVAASLQQGISTINTAVEAAGAVEDLTNQLKSLALQGSQTSDAAAKTDLATQYNALRGQLDTLVQDASYNGVNLLSSASASLSVRTGKNLSDTATVNPVDSSAASLGLNAVAADGSDFNESLITQIDNAAAAIRSTAQNLGSRSTELVIRADDALNKAQVYQSGADKLTLADSNTEAATALAARTRQQLGLNALSIANRNQQSILQLFS